LWVTACTCVVGEQTPVRCASSSSSVKWTSAALLVLLFAVERCQTRGALEKIELFNEMQKPRRAANQSGDPFSVRCYVREREIKAVESLLPLPDSMGLFALLFTAGVIEFLVLYNSTCRVLNGLKLRP